MKILYLSYLSHTLSVKMGDRKENQKAGWSKRGKGEELKLRGG